MAKRFRPPEEELETELNLVPYMDIMLNLIMFMLFSTTSLTQMGVINISLPSLGGGAPPPTETADETPEETAELTIAVSNEGFTVMVDGVEMDGNAGEITVKRMGADWDYPGLNGRLVDVKNEHSSTTTAILVASPNIEYEILVGVMDAARAKTDEKGKVLSELFPDVVLSVL